MTNHPNRSRSLAALKAQLRVTWSHGSQYGSDLDLERALLAAARVLRSAPADPATCKAAFEAAGDLGVDPRDHSAEATAWDQAEGAANIALTKGWHNPEGAYCDLQTAL